MSLLHKLLMISACSIMLTTHLNALNIAKLKLNGVVIHNTTSSEVIVSLETQSSCVSCKDSTAHQHWNIPISPQKSLTFYENSHILHDITLDHNQDFALYMSDIKNPHVLTLVRRPKGLEEDIYFDQYHNFLELMSFHNDSILLKECLKNQRPRYNTFLPKSLTASEILLSFAHLYDTYNDIPNREEANNQSSPIPHIIHQNWFGITGSMPILYQKWRREWRKRHPEWRYICWNAAMIKKAFPKKLYNQALFNHEADKPKKNYAKMSDIVRYEILKKFGGIYADCDTRCFESFNDLHQKFDFYINLEPLSACYFLTANFLIASVPQHPILTACLHEIKRRFNDQTIIDPQLHAGDHVMASTGPGMLFSAVLSGMTERTSILPNVYFSSFYHDYDVHRRPLSPYAYCIHDFACPRLKTQHHWSFALA